MRSGPVYVAAAVLFVAAALVALSGQAQTKGASHPDADSFSADLNSSGGAATILVPAVDSSGNGSVTEFVVRVMPGNGETLANIDHLFVFVDTQLSIQTAKSVAANVTGVDLSRYNIEYDIDVNDSSTGLVEGPSAGAALTVATIAAIEGKQPNSSVMITGTIEKDGSIGEIGGLPAKARAAMASGVRTFLVPAGQGINRTYSVEYGCSAISGGRECTSSYVPVDVSPGSGMTVAEVSDIREALKYFLQ